ncbi:hypothetical protein HaLaN_17864 [Haematococcus lacustris]|uniref:Uncharacterized protein n=1 Tax=Haematococcus lacustris TaxID=44745 RepID=A0A699ZM47_HAELA|nr:hypothetical protein HaLaN_17864 [Haematococcus lacustris]
MARRAQRFVVVAVWSAATVQSSELRAAHIATVHANAGPSTPPGKQREERRAGWKTQRRQVRTPALYAPALFVSPHCHQSPRWRRAARVQEDEAQADGPFPADGWGAQPAPRHRVTVCAQDLADMLGGLLHPGQLKVFCLYFANTTFLTPYNQLQRRLGQPGQNKHFSLKPAFDDPSNQELLQRAGAGEQQETDAGD